MKQRYDYLKAIAGDAGDALAVCTGWGAREWSAVRPSDGNLKTRTLGLVSSIAAGLALALPHRKVIAIDGDSRIADWNRQAEATFGWSRRSPVRYSFRFQLNRNERRRGDHGGSDLVGAHRPGDVLDRLLPHVLECVGKLVAHLAGPMSRSRS